MINIFFDKVFQEIINLLAKFLPSSSGLPDEVQTAFLTFISYLNGLNLIFPISTLFYILALYVGFEIGILTFYFVRFIINLIRGSGA